MSSFETYINSFIFISILVIIILIIPNKYINREKQFFLIVFILIIYIYIMNITVAYAEGITDELESGSIPRTPLFQPGQHIDNVNTGMYQVTGGAIQLGNVGNGTFTKVIGVVINGSVFDSTYSVYNPDNVEFNRNFAKVIYEMRAGGLRNLNRINLDYTTGSFGIKHPNFDFVTSYRASIGAGPLDHIPITNKLINGIAENKK